MDGGDSGVARGSDEDLKMLALNSLLNKDPATALPLLRGILSGNQPLSVKKHALFVLAQSKSPEAESILHDAALGKLDPQLQGQAIQYDGSISRQASQRYAGRGLPYDDRSEDQEVDYLRHVHYAGRTTDGRDGAERERSRVEADHRLAARLDERQSGD